MKRLRIVYLMLLLVFWLALVFSYNQLISKETIQMSFGDWGDNEGEVEGSVQLIKINIRLS